MREGRVKPVLHPTRNSPPRQFSHDGMVMILSPVYPAIMTKTFQTRTPESAAGFTILIGNSVAIAEGSSELAMKLVLQSGAFLAGDGGRWCDYGIDFVTDCGLAGWKQVGKGDPGGASVGCSGGGMPTGLKGSLVFIGTGGFDSFRFLGVTFR